MATDSFNLVFADIQACIEDEVANRGMDWLPAVNLRLLSEGDEDPAPIVSVSFVDDLTPSVTAPTPSRLMEYLGDLVDIVYELCARHGLKLNPTKTKIMLKF